MSGTGLEVWPDVLAHLRKNHPTICRRWFTEELKPVAMGGGTFSVRAHSSFHREYLANYCNNAFTEALQAVTGRLVAVRFIGPDQTVNTDGSLATAQATTEPAAVHTRSASAATTAAATATNGSARDHRPGKRELVAQHTTSRHSTDDDHSSATVGTLQSPAPARPSMDDDALDDIGSEEAMLRAPAQATRVERSAHTLHIDPDYDFDSFVVGPSNRLAHAAAKAVADNPGKAYNPLFIHGDVGLGKTHLLQAICLGLVERKPDAVICYLSCEGFMTEFMQAVRAGEMIEFRYRFRDVDVLVVDDIHYLGKRDRTQEEFFHTFNTLYQANKQIVLSSDAPPENIPDLQDRLVSRFKWGLVASVDVPSFETRIEILKTKAAIRGFELPDDVAFYIAQHATSHVRELEGHVNNLCNYQATDNCEITIDVARSLLKLEDVSTGEAITIHTIIDAVTDQFDVRLKDLQSKDRTRSIALPRQVCMYLAKQHTHLSLKEIGGYFGGRDHTTVLHAVRTVKEKQADDSSFAGVVRVIEQRLTGK